MKFENSIVFMMYVYMIMLLFNCVMMFSIYTELSDIRMMFEEAKIEETVDEKEPEKVAVIATEEPRQIAAIKTVEEIPDVKYFDVPLSEEVQDHIFIMCDTHNIDPALVISMIDKESDFDAGQIGDGGQSQGLMQIQRRWHSERMAALDVTDLLDPIDNITVGIDYLSELLDTGKGVEWALMAYNGGPSFANRLRAEGRVSDYARQVLIKRDCLT